MISNEVAFYALIAMFIAGVFAPIPDYTINTVYDEEVDYTDKYPNTTRCMMHNFDMCFEYYEENTIPVYESYADYERLLERTGRAEMREKIIVRRKLEGFYEPTLSFICVYYDIRKVALNTYHEMYRNYKRVPQRCNCTHYGIVSTYESFIISGPIEYENDAQINYRVYGENQPLEPLDPQCTFTLFDFDRPFPLAREYVINITNGWQEGSVEIDPFVDQCFMLLSCFATESFVAWDWFYYVSGEDRDECTVNRTRRRTTIYPWDTFYTEPWTEPFLDWLALITPQRFILLLCFLLLMFLLTTALPLYVGLRARWRMEKVRCSTCGMSRDPVPSKQTEQ